MAEVFGQEYAPEEIRARVGTMKQVAGWRRGMYTEGKEDGLRFLEMNNGVLDATILESRCMDLSSLHYRGIPLQFSGCNGWVHPAFADAMQQPLHSVGYAVVVAVVRFKLRRLLDVVRRAAHGERARGKAQHLHVVVRIADGGGLLRRRAQHGTQVRKRAGLVDAGGDDLAVLARRAAERNARFLPEQVKDAVALPPL